MKKLEEEELGERGAAMTVEEEGEGDGGEEGSSHGFWEHLSRSHRALFASRKERGEDPFSSPDPRKKVKQDKDKTLSLFSPGTKSPRTPSISPGAVRPKFLTPSQTFTRLRDERDEISRQTPSPGVQCSRDSFTLPLFGEIRYDYLRKIVQDWLRNPKNLALLFWGLAVGISGALLFMVMVGMLNAVIPGKSERDTWFEVNNQILNALFTLMCLYLHPQRCLHICLLYRWKPEDIIKLRDVYCKNGTRKPHEWAHMLVVVLLLQLNCVAQYALCGLNWGFRRSDRPAIGVAVCLSLSLGGAVGAGVYNIVSPLGKDFELEEEDSQVHDMLEKGEAADHHRTFAARTRMYKLLERRVSFAVRDTAVPVEHPEWKGGLLDCGDDKPVAFLSTICCVCVFGWNMDRLGFGNRYVHVVTFVLICTAPFWIFDLAAVNIGNKMVRHALGGTGIALCGFGLLYGGYWRIRMRQRFKLPGNHSCCGQPNVTDCLQWLFVPLCSLCQEVRTAESYDVRDDKFYVRQVRDADSPGMVTPPRTPPPGPNIPVPPTSLAPTLPLSSTADKYGSQEVELIAPDFNGEHMNRMIPPEPVVVETMDTSPIKPEP